MLSFTIRALVVLSVVVAGASATKKATIKIDKDKFKFEYGQYDGPVMTKLVKSWWERAASITEEYLAKVSAASFPDDDNAWTLATAEVKDKIKALKKDIEQSPASTEVLEQVETVKNFILENLEEWSQYDEVIMTSPKKRFSMKEIQRLLGHIATLISESESQVGSQAKIDIRTIEENTMPLSVHLLIQVALLQRAGLEKATHGLIEGLKVFGGEAGL